MNSKSQAVLMLVLLLAGSLVSAQNPAEPEETPEEKKKLRPVDLKLLDKALECKGQVINDKVFQITMLRTDLDVHTPEFGDIPPEAGFMHTFRVWRCPCGKYYIMGEFCLLDYEANDVLDSLRKEMFNVASVGNILLREKPRLVAVKFFGEGDMKQIANALKECLRWVGENRTRPNPVK